MKQSVAELSAEFRALVNAKIGDNPPRTMQGRVDVLAVKSANAVNGLETSTFTVCTRIRPTLGAEREQPEGFVVVAPDLAPTKMKKSGKKVASALDYTERVRVLTPKVHAVRGAVSWQCPPSPFLCTMHPPPLPVCSEAPAFCKECECRSRTCSSGNRATLRWALR